MKYSIKSAILPTKNQENSKRVKSEPIVVNTDITFLERKFLGL